MHRRADICWSLTVALAFTAGAAGAAAWPEVAEPENVESEWVSKDMIYNGIPMRVSRFTSTRSSAEVVAFYTRQWPGQVVVNELAGKTVVGHAQGEHYITVEVSAKGRGSQAQIGIVRMLDRKPKAAAGADFLKPSGTQVVNDITYLDTPGRTLTMESPLSPFQSEAFYASRLPGKGWKRDTGGSPCSMIARQCVARYSKGSQDMTLTFHRYDQVTSIVVNQTQP